MHSQLDPPHPAKKESGRDIIAADGLQNPHHPAFEYILYCTSLYRFRRPSRSEASSPVLEGPMSFVGLCSVINAVSLHPPSSCRRGPGDFVHDGDITVRRVLLRGLDSFTEEGGLSSLAEQLPNVEELTIEGIDGSELERGQDTLRSRSVLCWEAFKFTQLKKLTLRYSSSDIRGFFGPVPTPMSWTGRKPKPTLVVDISKLAPLSSNVPPNETWEPFALQTSTSRLSVRVPTTERLSFIDQGRRSRSERY